MSRMFKPVSKEPEVIGAVIPTLKISPVALAKMMLYIENVDVEVGWLGSIIDLGCGEYVCDDVYLLDQNVTAIETDITSESLIKFAIENEDVVDRAFLWGHSHVDMGVTPSGQDEFQVKELSKNGIPYLFRLIGNKRGDIDITFISFANNYEVLNVKWEVYVEELSSLEKAVKKEIEAKVHKVLETPYTYSYKKYKSPAVNESEELYYAAIYNDYDALMEAVSINKITGIAETGQLTVIEDLLEPMKEYLRDTTKRAGLSKKEYKKLLDDTYDEWASGMVEMCQDIIIEEAYYGLQETS